MPALTHQRCQFGVAGRSNVAAPNLVSILNRAFNLALALAIMSGSAVAGAAPEPPLGFDDAAEVALANAPDITGARSNLLAAERDLERALRDPLATGLERLQAQHAQQEALAAIAAAERSSRVSTLQHVTNVLEGEAALRHARDQADVAQRQLTADRVRAEAGTITQLDLVRSEAEAERAQRASFEAANEQGLRWSELALHLGCEAEALRARGLAAIEAPPPALPPFDALLEQSGLRGEPANAAHAGVAAASRSLAVARVQLAGTDHEAAAPNLVANARDAVATAERRLADTLAQAELQLRTHHQNYGAALGRLADAAVSDANAATTLEAQRVRAEAGELAPLALRQAEMERERSTDAWRAARHAAWLAYLRLEQAVAGQ